MDIAFVGGGPGLEAVAAALAERSVTVDRCAPEAIDTADVAVVRAGVGDQVFDDANRAALDGETAWIAIEVGGLGGHERDDIEVGVAGFAPPETACYACLRDRISTGNGSGDGVSVSPGTERFAGALVGQELLRLLGGGQSTLLGGVVDLPATRTARELLSMPSCGCQLPLGVFELKHRSEPPAEEVVQETRRAIDDLVGPIRDIEEFDPYPVACTLATGADESFGDEHPMAGVTGAGMDWTTAMARTVRAALGRYCADVVRPGRVIEASPSTLELTVDPASLVLPTGASPDAVTRWVVGRRLADGTPGHIPAERFYDLPGDPQLGRGATVGIGVASSTAVAMRRALYRTVAHDAAILSWYLDTQLSQIELPPDALPRLRRRVEAEGLSMTPLLVTQDIDIPAVAVAVHRDEWPRFAIGVGANLDPIAATREGLLRALARWKRFDALDRDSVRENSLGRYADFSSSVQEFITADDRVSAASVRPDEVPEGFDEYLAAVERATAVGEPYGVRLTTIDVATLGLEVGAVIVPGTHPYFDGLAAVDGVTYEHRDIPEPRNLDERPPHPFPGCPW